MRIELDSLGRQIAQKESDEARSAAYRRPGESSGPSRGGADRADAHSNAAAVIPLLQKKEESQISANLERRQIGEQFKILDPARMPEAVQRTARSSTASLRLRPPARSAALGVPGVGTRRGQTLTW
jgi:hypothetical protein